MTTRHRKETFLRRLIMPTVSAAFLGYFAYHAFHGEYGMLAEARLKHEVASLQKELDGLVKKRQTLAERVAKVRPESLDADLIDELARASLNYAREGDVVVLLDANREPIN